MADTRARHRAWTREHGEDLPEVADWAWPSRARRPMTSVLVVNAGSSSLKLRLLDAAPTRSSPHASTSRSPGSRAVLAGD